MVNEWAGGKKRFAAAGDIVLRLMDSIYSVNDGVEFSLRVYGHQHGVGDSNCFDTRREVMFSKNNFTQMSLRLGSLEPLGVSPIAYSLRVAAENDFVDERDYAYSLILITDGGESCGGNICDVVKNLLDKKIEFKPYIVSLVDYAPLKDQYNCLGNYLTVSKPGEVAPAIHTIAEAYRKVLAVPIAKPKLLNASDIPSPSVQKISVPAIKVAIKEPETTQIVKQPEIKTVVVDDTVRGGIISGGQSKIKVDASFFTKEHISRINRKGLKSIIYDLAWDINKLPRRATPRFPLPPKETAPIEVAAQPTNKPAPKPATIKPAPVLKTEPKEASYTVKLEPAAETLLEIYFTDGKGKFYTTTPPVQLIDSKTGMDVKRFYRTVDASGNPDPQKVAPGNYNLVIGKSGNYKTKAITVQAANTNKINIVVTKGTLIFRYDDNPKRPVKEYLAQVRKTFQAGTSIVQKCTEEREYEPGNYHIEINTLPMMVRNIDLEFGWSYTIDIPEPGFLQFTNANAVGKVSLWSPLGDQFARFYGMEVTGNKQAQSLQLLPGIYEAHWKRNPSHPNEPEVIQKFRVKSNETTELELQ